MALSRSIIPSEVRNLDMKRRSRYEFFFWGKSQNHNQRYGMGERSEIQPESKIRRLHHGENPNTQATSGEGSSWRPAKTSSKSLLGMRCQYTPYSCIIKVYEGTSQPHLSWKFRSIRYRGRTEQHHAHNINSLIIFRVVTGTLKSTPLPWLPVLENGRKSRKMWTSQSIKISYPLRSFLGSNQGNPFGQNGSSDHSEAMCSAQSINPGSQKTYTTNT